MPSLSLGILSMVVSTMSPYDSLSISTTCKAIHRMALRRALESVSIRSPWEMAKFPGFVLADPTNRIPLIHSLFVGTSAFQSPTKRTVYYTQIRDILDEDELACIRRFASFLTLVFTQSRTLRTLNLHSSSYMFVEFPDLRDAFINMDCLVELSLDNPTNQVMEFVKEMRSTLRCLLLESPTSVFSGMVNQRHLESFELRVDPAIGIFIDKTVTQWPTVRSLTVKGYVPMKPFVNAFPNVRSLRVAYFEPDEDRYDGFEHGPPVQWVGLDHLQGATVDLRQWDIHCPVRWLELDSIVHKDPTVAESQELLEPVLQKETLDIIRRTAPMILSLSVYNDVASEFWKELEGVTGQTKLLELTVFDKLDGNRESGMNSWQAQVPELFGGLQVLCLRICLASLDGDAAHSDAQRERELREAIVGLQDLLAHSPPRLQYIAIADGPFRRRKMTHDSKPAHGMLPFGFRFTSLKEEFSWWRVLNPGGADEGALITHVPRWDGERLRERLHGMDYEELLGLRAQLSLIDK